MYFTSERSFLVYTSTTQHRRVDQPFNNVLHTGAKRWANMASIFDPIRVFQALWFKNKATHGKSEKCIGSADDKPKWFT